MEASKANGDEKHINQDQSGQSGDGSLIEDQSGDGSLIDLPIDPK